MKVLVLGATGFVGNPVAQALVRAGHIVYGLARTPAKAKELAAQEIVPIQGDADLDSSRWVALIATLDVLIDCAGSADGSLGQSIFERVTAAAQNKRPAGNPKLSFVYTSGAWVHGDSRTAVFTDTTPIGRTGKDWKPVELLAGWRPALEQRVRTSQHFNGIVIRPSYVYGRSGSITGILFQSAKSGKVRWPGTPGAFWSFIHQDDMADLYVRVAERGQILGGQVFDASDGVPLRAEEVLQRLVEVSGANGYEYTVPANKFEEALASSGKLRPYLGKALVGWEPKKIGLLEGLEVYYAAWEASLAA